MEAGTKALIAAIWVFLVHAKNALVPVMINVCMIIVVATIFAMSKKLTGIPFDSTKLIAGDLNPCGPPNTNLLQNPNFAKRMILADSEEGVVDDWMAEMTDAQKTDKIGVVRSGTTASGSVVAPNHGIQMALIRTHGGFLQQQVSGLKAGCTYRLSVNATGKPDPTDTAGYLGAFLDASVEIMPRQKLVNTGIFTWYGPYTFKATKTSHVIRLMLTCDATCPTLILIATVSLTT